MQKKSIKKGKKPRTIYMRIQNRKRLLIGVFCVLISIFVISKVTFFPETESSMVGGLDICFLPEDGIQLTGEKPFVGLVPITDSHNIIVTLSIAGVFENYPEKIVLYFPGITTAHCIVKEITDTELREELQDSQDILRKTRVPVSEQIEVTHDSSLNLDTILMNPNQIEGYSGVLEFIWVDGVSQIDFATFRIDLPIRPLLIYGGENHNCEFNEYKIQVWLWSGFEIISSISEISRYKKMLGMEYYVFEVDKTKTDFYVVFTSSKAAQCKDTILMIASIFLGIGLTEIFEDLWKSERRK